VTVDSQVKPVHEDVDQALYTHPSIVTFLDRRAIQFPVVLVVLVVLADQVQTFAHPDHSSDLFDHPSSIVCASQSVDPAPVAGAVEQSSYWDPNMAETRPEEEEEELHLRQEGRLHSYPCPSENSGKSPVGHLTVGRACLHRYSAVSP